MRIGMIAPPWLPVPPNGYGGTEAVIDRLARGLQAAGHEVVLCAVRGSTCPVLRHTRSQPAAERIGMILPEACHVLDAYEVLGDVDVIHDHTLLGALTAPRSAVPIVVTNHGPFDDELRPLFAAIAGRASVVAISHSQARSAEPGTVDRVIHHGIDVQTRAPGAGLGGYLAFLGRMSPTKGVLEAIDIASAAGLPLRIAAKCREPAELEYFEQLIRPRLGSAVEYLGEIAHEERDSFLGEAVALLNPIQWSEPFGLVMVEALAVGTPVLALANGAAPEIVSHGVTGFLGDRNEDLIEAVGLVDRLDRAACRRVVEQRFSTKRMVDEHVDLFARVRADSSQRSPLMASGTARQEEAISTA